MVSMSLFDKFFAPDPHTPPINPVTIVPTIPREDLAAARAATGIPAPLKPGRVTILPGSFTLPDIPYAPVVEEEVKIVKAPEVLPPFHPQVPRVMAPEIEPTKFIAPQPVEEPEVEIVKEPEVVVAKKESELDASRVFVNEYLGEISELLIDGKELEKLLEDRKDKEKAVEDVETRFNQMHDARMKVGTSIANLFGEGQGGVSEKKLQAVSEAYEAYLETFSAEIKKVGQERRLDLTKANMVLNAKKNRIKEIFNKAGGQENVEKIKNVIRICEKAALNARGAEEFSRISPEYKKDISEKVAMFVKGDLEGAKLHVEQGRDIVDVLRLIYAAQI